jgi:hypothetical protein
MGSPVPAPDFKAQLRAALANNNKRRTVGAKRFTTTAYAFAGNRRPFAVLRCVVSIRRTETRLMFNQSLNCTADSEAGQVAAYTESDRIAFDSHIPCNYFSSPPPSPHHPPMALFLPARWSSSLKRRRGCRQRTSVLHYAGI